MRGLVSDILKNGLFVGVFKPKWGYFCLIESATHWIRCIFLAQINYI